MELTSATILPGSPIPLRHCGPACGGQNISPPLRWSGTPRGTRSCAVLCIDPDARIAGGWWHWVVYDIPAGTVELPEGGPLPAGCRVWRNDYQREQWDGPCPPPGPAHHYHFTVHALDVPTLLMPRDKASVRALIASHSLAEATLIGTFGRPRR